MVRRAVILADKALGTLEGKTANVLVMYNRRRFDVVAVIDSSHAGMDAGEVLGIGKVGIPVVLSLEEALKRKPEALIVGVATIGGFLPPEYRLVVRQALKLGLEVWSGLHQFLGDDPEFASLAREHGARIVDVRRPPTRLRIWSGEVLRTRCGRVLVAGTDCVVGKNVTVLEVAGELERNGLKPGIAATGQTLILAGAHAGVVVDAIPSDFCPGVVEEVVLDLDSKGLNPVVVEGQASILHPAYGQVSLAILYGCMPDAVILAHDPWRKVRDGFDQPMRPLEHEIEAIRLTGGAEVVAISVMGWGRSRSEIEEACEGIERRVGLPAADPRRNPGKLVDAVVDRLKSVGKL